jgi:outer membrane biosynthesis protein TonB
MDLKKLKRLDTKIVTRIATVAVLLISLAILGVAGWFIMSALDKSSAGAAVEEGGIHIETLNQRLLDQVKARAAEKRAGGQPLPTDLRNPFVAGTAPPPPPPPPQPEPEPQPETPMAPEAPQPPPEE